MCSKACTASKDAAWKMRKSSPMVARVRPDTKNRIVSGFSLELPYN
jgi:hypothetical protein